MGTDDTEWGEEGKRRTGAAHDNGMGVDGDHEVKRLCGDVGVARPSALHESRSYKVRIGRVKLWQKTHSYEPSYWLPRSLKKVDTASS